MAKTTMKAIVLTKPYAVGEYAKSVTVVEDAPVPPAPTGNQILVKVERAGILLDDVHIVENSFIGGLVDLAKLSKRKTGYTPGSEFTGVVEGVGPDARRLKVGDRVYGMCDAAQTYNAMAEYCLVDEPAAGIVPDNWTPEHAVAAPMATFVGDAAIKEIVKTHGTVKDKRIVVIGASGSIGNVLTQELVIRGAKVVGICSHRNVETVQALGTERVIDYTVQPWHEPLTGVNVDAVVDLVGGRKNESSGFKVMGRSGVYITAVGPIQFVGEKILSGWEKTKFGMHFAHRYTTSRLNPFNPMYRLVTPTVRDFEKPAFDTSINFAIDSVHPFTTEGMRAAYERVLSHRSKGKVLVDMTSSSGANVSES